MSPPNDAEYEPLPLESDKLSEPAPPEVPRRDPFQSLRTDDEPIDRDEMSFDPWQTKPVAPDETPVAAIEAAPSSAVAAPKVLAVPDAVPARDAIASSIESAPPTAAEPPSPRARKGESPSGDESEEGTEFAAILAAVQFLSRVPTPEWLQDLAGSNAANWQRDLQRGVAYFPLVGAAIGFATAVSLEVCAWFWPLSVAILLAMVLEAFLTGALHEDAVADCADGLGGGWTSADALRIMKDSRVGSYGVLALVLVVALRFTLLGTIPIDVLWAVVLGSACLGRAAMTMVMLVIPPPPEAAGLGKLAATKATPRVLGIAGGSTLLALAPWLWYAPLSAGAGGLLAVLAALGFGLYARSRLGGATGDVLGATCVLAQLAALLAASSFLRPLP